jgi:hypothetical protein
MAEEKELTPEQKAEFQEKAAEVGKKNLESSLWDYATPKFVTHEQYGQLANGAQAFYQKAISKTPDQHVYEQLFYSQLTNEGGAITSPYLQNKSAAILQESLFTLKVEDAVKYAGYNGEIDEKYKGKYVTEIDEKEAGQIVGSAIQYKTDGKVKEILELRQKNISKNLEEVLKPKEEKPESE